MKELSIEQKAKAYDEAIERARKSQENSNGMILKKWLCNIFPELKEPEDERIRKELIAYHRSMAAAMNGNRPCVHEAWIAWLEKQEGCEYIKKDWLEHIKQSWYKEGFIDGKYSGGTSKEWTINDAATLKELIDFLENGTAKLQHDLTKYANWLKIQFTPIEKQSEQKPSNKVEPKFHEGEWVVTSYGKVNQVIAVDKDGDGFTLDDDTYFSGSWKDGYHFWTIKDAKDGDILQSNNKPFIYNEYLEEGKYPFGYGGINLYGRFGVSNGLLPMTHDEVTPATKEQRDTLFTKMKEAGYEWDTDKKELKKIGQKPTNENLTDVGHEYYSELLSNDDSDNIDEYAYQCAYCMSHDWMKETATWEDIQKAVKLGAEWQKQKSTWSKEDEEFFNDIIDFFKNEKNALDHINWFKSLKDRVQSKSKQEWSEEDKEMLGRIRSIVEKYAFSQSAVDVNGDLCKKEYIDADNWLKSLKPQKQWKPSDEQMDALEYYATSLSTYSDRQDDLFSLLKSLKKLKGE